MPASGSYPKVEVAVDSVEAAAAAWRHGGDRIELCQALEVGGLTPSLGLIEAVLQEAKGPVFAMIRPRPGSFVLLPGDLDVMAKDIDRARRAGCAGIVIGAITAGGRVDAVAMGSLMAAAGGVPVTFHRAFDWLTTGGPEAMAELAALGVERVLTAGGSATAFAGRDEIGRLRRASGPIVVAGGGVTGETVVALVAATGVTEVHLSGVRFVDLGPAAFGRNSVPNPERVRLVVAALHRAYGRPAT